MSYRKSVIPGYVVGMQEQASLTKPKIKEREDN